MSTKNAAAAPSQSIKKLGLVSEYRYQIIYDETVYLSTISRAQCYHEIDSSGKAERSFLMTVSEPFLMVGAM
jgi:hypothetical protein